MTSLLIVGAYHHYNIHALGLVDSLLLCKYYIIMTSFDKFIVFLVVQVGPVFPRLQSGATVCAGELPFSQTTAGKVSSLSPYWPS